MTQTPKLKLNTWSPDDPVQVAQINQNFLKIDAESKYTKLAEINDTVGGANQLDVNLSSIHINDYAYLELVGCLSSYKSGVNVPKNVIVRFNNSALQVYANLYYSSYGSNNVFTTGLGPLLDSSGFENGSAASFRLILHPCREYLMTEISLISYSYYDSNNINFTRDHIFGMYTSPTVTPNTLNSINFIINSAGKVYMPGSNICVYGVRK